MRLYGSEYGPAKKYNTMFQMFQTLNATIISYGTIHSIPEVQVLLHTINIPPTLHLIRLQELPNLCQVPC